MARSNEVADEVISSMRTVRSFANENGEARKYDDRLSYVLKIGIKKSLAFTGYTWINEVDLQIFYEETYFDEICIIHNCSCLIYWYLSLFYGMVVIWC